VMSGFGGKPVQIKNLPSAAYQDYTQYKSVVHTHASDKAKWSHAGTNGFTSTMDVGSR
jgi:ribulose-5-phosphate 4-epimerase/fuculose-1-phosphate aldolase